jgi:hypothetical protein
MLYRKRQQRAKTCGVRRATSSAFKGIKVWQVDTRCYLSESHYLTAGWASRPPRRVFNRVFGAHGRKAVLKPQYCTKAERRQRQCLRKQPPSIAPMEAASCWGQFKRRAEPPVELGRSNCLAAELGHALDPFVIAASCANAFWQTRCTNAVTAW